MYEALKVGYRLLDGAGDYGNEKEAGEVQFLLLSLIHVRLNFLDQGLARAIKDGIVKREDVCE